MKKWDVNRESLLAAFTDEPAIRTQKVPVNIIEAPDKKKCAYIYGFAEPRMDFFFGNFMILTKDEKNTKIRLKSDYNHIVCCGTKDNVSWSSDSRFLGIDIYPLMPKFPGHYRFAKLLMDMKEEKFSIVMTAGGRNQEIKFVNNMKLNFTHKKNAGNPLYYYPLEGAAINIGKLRWVKVCKFSKAIDMLERGYFGDIVGYKNEEINIRFKNGYIPWQYKGLVKRRPK